KWYSEFVGGLALSGDTSLSTGMYYVSQTVGGCESARTSVSVTVSSVLTPYVAISQTVGSEYLCSGSGGFVSFEAYATDSGTAPSYEWLVNDVVQSGFTGSTFNYYVTSDISVKCRITVTDSSGCYTATTAGSSPVSISIVEAVATVTAQGPTSFCYGGSVSLVPTGIGANGIGVWVKDNSYYDAAYEGVALTVSEGGSYRLELYTEYGCSANSSDVVVTVTATPAPIAEVTQVHCQGNTVSQLSAQGTNLQWYASQTGGTALPGSTLLTEGTYYVSQTINNCEGERAAVTVTINATPAPSAPSAQGYCQGATVSQLNATGTGVQWYTSETGGTALAATEQLTTATYYASQTLNGCEGERTAVSITITTTAAPTAPAQSYCQGATVTTLTATGTGIQWYTAQTGGVALAANTVLATGTYYASQTVNGCESTRTAVNVTITTTAAPTAQPQTYCGGTTVAGLVATGTDIKWYAAQTGGTALAVTAPLVTRTYYASQTVNGCEGPRTAVAITINNTAQPTASSQSYCSGTTVAGLVATGTDLKWYSASTGGTPLATTTALASGAYYVSQTLNGCESTRRAVTVTITTTAAPTASAQNFCNSATVGSLTATGSGIKWYTTQTGGTALAASTALTTRTYYASQTVNGCEGPRTAVAVTVTTTVAPSTQPQTLCYGATVSGLVATGSGIKWYTVQTGGTALAGTATVTAGTYYASQTVNGCEGPRASSVVSLQQPAEPTISISSSDMRYDEQTGFYTVCGGSQVTFAALTTHTGVNPVYQWSVNGEIQEGATGRLYTTELPDTGYLWVSATVTVSPEACATHTMVSSEDMYIDLIEAPYAAIIAQGSTTFCQGGSVTLQAIGAENYEGVWLHNNEYYDYVTAGYNETITVSAPGVYSLDVAGYDNNCSASASITITEAIPVTPAVSLSANVSGPIAAGTAVTFTATPTNGGTSPYYEFKVNGNTVHSSSSATYTTTTLAHNDIVTVQLTSNASCATTATAISNAITMVINGPGTVTPEPGAGGILYVKKGSSGTGTGWGDALGEVADALKYAKQANSATPGTVTQVWVAGGTYTPMYHASDLSGASPQGRNNAFVLVNGLQVYGGFAGTESGPEERDLTLAANASILSGDFLNNDNGGINNTENAYHVVMAVGTTASPVTSATVLDGFTVTAGFGNASGSITVNGVNANNNSGGGIYNSNASPTLRNLIIKGNRVGQSGGGMCNINSSPVLTNVLFAGNTATNGGGMHNTSSPAVLTNVTMSGNTSTNGGGTGGAVYNIFSSPQVRNTIIYGNGTGVYNTSTASAPVYSYSLVQGLTSTANGNVSGASDPLFANAAGGDYSIGIGSPALNSGSNAYYAAGQLPDLSGVAKDLGGQQRIYNAGVVDMGAYEFQQDCAVATTWNGTAWSNGIPTSYIYTATISGNYSGGSITACSLAVTGGAVSLASGVTFTIKGAVTVSAGASFTVQNNAALVQQDDTANTGNITVIKNSNPLYRLDYTIWSSPVAGQNLQAFSPQTTAGRFYEYKYDLDPASNSYVEQYFIVNAATTSFDVAKAYMIRMPNSSTVAGYNAGTAPLVYAGTFNGVAHNGTLTRRASQEGDRYTGVGNPYPSPISVADFFKGNSDVIEGGSALYFWRKRNDAASSSYATLNLAGFTANAGLGGGSDQAAFYTGPNSTWLIAQGQGFLVQTKEDPTAADITFTNSMRRPVPTSGNQSFFRTGSQREAADAAMSRYWLNLSSAANSNSFSQAMVAYRPDATLELDYGYDGRLLNDGGRIALYSLAGETSLAIQSRPDFEVGDVVPMGFTAVTPGDYTLSLDRFDGLFDQGQDIYLKDNQLGLTHDLADGGYAFSTAAGTFNDRFEVVYAREVLG
ncbi:hypothetical protein GR160_19165, partial [Flavobacterium sp. Sd200]|uniref:beta strand repeat-containing protein n=1 Tax=Flavobacterium sp. Sd200 TaxID=2692211 RepID=UPI00144C121E|nr:hypothetical protein [Flavobacterium sp. Sd200]